MDEAIQDFIGQPIPNPIQQTYPDTCAIKSQQIIMNEFGIPVTEDQCVQYSTDQGWYTGNGTMPEDVGKLLTDAGIPCTQSVDCNVLDLMDQLQQGHRVIVGVDSGELWSENSIWESIKEWFEDLFGDEIPDHALIVAGLDMTDPDNPMVILTDPGTGEACHPYPLDDFMDAWADSQHFMVATDIPTPAAVGQFEQNGINDYHLPQIAGVEHDVFQDFLNYSHQLDFDTDFMSLYNVFDQYPQMDSWTCFDDVLNYNQDIFSTPFIQPEFPFDTPVFDPSIFDIYNCSMPDLSYIDCFDSGDNTPDQHAIDKLTGLYDDAMRHYQDCLDNGMYVSAVQWHTQANDIQADINRMSMGL